MAIYGTIGFLAPFALPLAAHFLYGRSLEDSNHQFTFSFMIFLASTIGLVIGVLSGEESKSLEFQKYCRCNDDAKCWCDFTMLDLASRDAPEPPSNRPLGH